MGELNAMAIMSFLNPQIPVTRPKRIAIDIMLSTAVAPAIPNIRTPAAPVEKTIWL